MSSTTEETECPQCRYENALYEMETKSFQESLFCDRCGYSWASKPKGASGLRETSETRGYGVLQLTYYDRSPTLEAFTVKPSDDQVEEIRGRLLDASIDVARSYLTLWDEEAKTLKLIAGELPKPK